MKNINQIYNINKFFMEPYLKLIEQIGEGAFSKLYIAYDSLIKKYVALKVEKFSSKNSVLKSEYEIFKQLGHLSCIPKIYKFITNITNEVNENKQLNCIEMELLGKNLIYFKQSFGYYNNLLTYDIIIRCLQDIQKIHEAGYIHRDIKPSNFCLQFDYEKNIIYNYRNNIYFNHDIKVYLIDFGLVKKISKNDKEKESKDYREKNNGFIGTLTYASINAHQREELGKRDDLWSFFFMFLDLMGENLPWRNIDSRNEKEFLECKKKCLSEPEKYLFLKSTKNNVEIINIFEYLKNLKFETEPDYNYILNQLSILKNKEIQKILYNNEINNQIMILQQNLLTKNIEPNNNKAFLNSNRIPQQDYIIYKLNKTNNKSIPSLNSTNYTSSIYYKTNYINCISGNNNENFYQSVLKPCSTSPNKINGIKNVNYQTGNNKYDYNKMINIHSFNYKENTNYNKTKIEQSFENNIQKKEEKFQDDKSLIEFLSGKSNDSYLKKEENRIDKKNRKVTKIKKQYKKNLNIHDKRKNIKFNIKKKDT